MTQLLLSLCLIVTGLFCGYSLKTIIVNKWINCPFSIKTLRFFFQKTGVFFLMPVAFCGAIWGAERVGGEVLLLPLIGAFAICSGGLLGLLWARILGVSPEKKAILFGSGSFANIGCLGGLLCYVFLGEAGFALLIMYKFFEELLYYMIGFPLMRQFAGKGGDSSHLSRFISVVTDPLFLVTGLAFGSGLTLNLLGVPRPHFYADINSVFVPLGTFVLLVSIGLSFRFSAFKDYVREAIGISIIKITIVPALAVGLAMFLGLDSLSMQVVLIAASMPVAFNTLVAASLYDLDIDMANTCWLISTSSLLLTLPCLYVLLALL